MTKPDLSEMDNKTIYFVLIKNAFICVMTYVITLYVLYKTAILSIPEGVSLLGNVIFMALIYFFGLIGWGVVLMRQDTESLSPHMFESRAWVRFSIGGIVLVLIFFTDKYIPISGFSTIASLVITLSVFYFLLNYK